MKYSVSIDFNEQYSIRAHVSYFVMFIAYVVYRTEYPVFILHCTLNNAHLAMHGGDSFAVYLVILIVCT